MLRLSFGNRLKKPRINNRREVHKYQNGHLHEKNNYTRRLPRGCKLFKAASFQSIIAFGMIVLQLLLILYHHYVITCRHHFRSVEANACEKTQISDVYNLRLSR